MARLIFSPRYGSYDFGAEHPFSPVRVEMTLDLLRALGKDPQWHEPPPASRDDLLAVHSEAYLRVVEALSAGKEVPDAAAWGLGTPDTPAFPGMDLAARVVVGGTLEAARLVASGAARRVLQFGGGFHHAQPERAAGFCVFNDLAIAIKRLVESGLLVSYLDIDVHHGDGTQAAFNRDERVQTISLHESGQYLFPGSGEIHELGEGPARGTKVNLPLEPFTEGASFLEVFDQIVPRAIAEFGPHVLVVQAGADAHFDDPLADLALSTHDYEQLFRRILAIAAEQTAGRVIFTLGGGYSLPAVARVWSILYLVVNDLALPQLIPNVWSRKWAARLGQRPAATLHDPEAALPAIPRRDEISRRNRVVASRLLEALSRYWV